MGNVVPLFDKNAVYSGKCLQCELLWTVTQAQLDVALSCGILYSPCCSKPATITKMKFKRHDKKNLQSL